MAKSTKTSVKKAARALHQPAPVTPERELVIAVTGHRAFARGEKRVAALITDEMKRLAKTYPRVPAVVLTALAEGADRMVAKIAQKVLGARVLVCLPMPAPAYEMDFVDTSSRKAFRAMLKAADGVVTAPILSKGRAWRSWTEERNHQYAWGGAYVAANADVLFAIWDGKPARGTGGTAHVVDWFLDGRTPRRYAMSRWRLKRGACPAKYRTLVHVNPESLKTRRRRAA
jgi:hypothetical protein